MAKTWQCFHYPLPVNWFYTGTVKVLITHSQYHCTTAHIKSSYHPLTLHRSTSNSSSTTNFPRLTSVFQSNSLNCVVAPNVFKVTPRHAPLTENMWGVRYPASSSARWLDLQKTHHATTTQLVHWRVDCCIATGYNICLIVACAYRGMFIEPLPSSALSKSVTIRILLLFEISIKLTSSLPVS
jgi:hypothetical protein